MLRDEEKREINRMSSEGSSISMISKKTGRDRKTVRKALGLAGKRTMGKDWGKDASESPQKEGEGKLAARVFGRLNNGERLEVIVEKEEITPDKGIELYEKWRKIKELQSADDILKQARSMLDTIQSSIRMTHSLANRVSMLEKGAGATPLWNLRQYYECPDCKRRGTVMLTVLCSTCGHWGNFGWPPDRG